MLLTRASGHFNPELLIQKPAPSDSAHRTATEAPGPPRRAPPGDGALREVSRTLRVAVRAASGLLPSGHLGGNLGIDTRLDSSQFFAGHDIQAEDDEIHP